MKTTLAGLALILGGAASAAQPAPPASPVAASSATETLGLLDEFYASTFSLAGVRARADRTLAVSPDDASAHEVAAYAAILAADPHEAWAHFMKAAADPAGPLTEIYLEELSSLELTATERKALMSLLADLSARAARPRARAVAAYELARLDRLDDRLPEAASLERSLGFLSDWLVLGSLDNDEGKGFSAVFPPEKEIKLDEEVPGAVVPVKWRRWKNSGGPGGVPLGEFLFPNEFGLAYLLAYVRSETAQKAYFRVTTGSPTRVWWNDRLALSKEKLSAGGLDNLSVAVNLAKGWNKVLIKSANRKGRWSVAARITDAAGEPIPGLLVSLEPKAYKKDEVAVSTEPVAPPTSDGAAPPARRLFLDARLLSQWGHDAKALESAQDYLAKVPGNWLAQYYASLYYQKSEQSGKEIDLIEKAVRSSQNKIPGFLLERARFYRDKKLYQKAQDDLAEALSLKDAGRSAEVALADLFAQRGWTIDQCRELDKILKDWPDDVRAVRDLGSCLSGRGYVERALKTLARARELEPGSMATLRRQLDLAWSRSDLGGAAGLVKDWRRFEPDSPAPLTWEADIARISGDAKAAAAALGRAAEIAPTWAAPERLLGDLAYEAGDKDSALRRWKRALALDSGNSALAQHIEFLEPLKLGWIGGLIPGDEDIERVLSRKVEPHPASFGAMLLDHTVTEVKADGSCRNAVTAIYRPFNDGGRDSLILHRLPGGANLQILRAYSVNKAGEREEAASIRGGEVRFRNLEVGSNVILQYVYYTPQLSYLKGNYSGENYFQAVGWQHEESAWIVAVPKDRRLTTVVSAGIRAREDVEGERRVYRYSASDVPPIPREPFMPAAADLVRRIEVSTLDNWDEFVRWERGLLLDAFEDNPKSKELVARLTDGAASPREKLDRIFHHVAEDIRYQQDYETSIAGVRPHPPSVVLERGYGDCKDKASLLIGLAKLAGIRVQFALLRTTPNGKILRKVPNLQFDHAIVYVPKQKGFDRPFFMDPTAERQDMGVLREDDQGALSLVIDPKSAKFWFVPIPYQEPEFQSQDHKMEIRVKSLSEILASDRLTLRGRSARGFRYVLSNRSEAQKNLEAFVGAFVHGSTLLSWTAEDSTNTWHPLGLDVDLDLTNAVQSETGLLRIPLPRDFPLDGTDATNVRENPLQLGAPDVYRSQVRLGVPAGYRAVQTPQDFSVAHSCFSAERRTKNQGREVLVDFSYRRRCTDLTAAEYPRFRKAVQEVKKRLSDSIVLGKTPRP